MSLHVIITILNVFVQTLSLLLYCTVCKQRNRNEGGSMKPFIHALFKCVLTRKIRRHLAKATTAELVATVDGLTDLLDSYKQAILKREKEEK